MCYHSVVKNRIVLDTSIIISALIGERGPSRRLLRRCLQGDYVPLISNALFLEYEAVSNRGVIQEQSPLTQEEIREPLRVYNE